MGSEFDPRGAPPRRWLRRLLGLLGAPSAPIWIVLLGMFLVLPSIDTGAVADDHFHHIVIQEIPAPGVEVGPNDLFSFATGDPTAMHAAQDFGLFPWWAQSDLKLSFMRPVSVMTHQVDQALWPDAIWLHHAQSILWYGFLLIALALLYWRLFRDVPDFLPPGVSVSAIPALALLIYAVDDAHGPVVGWVANRNALVAVTLSLLVLTLHDLQRTFDWQNGTRTVAGERVPVRRFFGSGMSYAMLVLALLAGESAIAVGAYLFAYAVFIDTDPQWKRWARLAPYLVIVVLWRFAYSSSGFGTHGSSLYIDPASDPLAFLSVAAARVPVLLSASYGGVWSDFWPMYPPSFQPVIVLFSLISLAGITWFAWPALRSSPAARFFATGACLAAFPIAATAPSDRLLPFVTVGTAGLLATALVARVGTTDKRSVRVAVAVVVGIHLILAAPLLAVRSRSMQTVADFVSLSDESWPADLAGKTLIFINPPMDPAIAYVQLARVAEGRETAAHTRWLAGGNTAMTITRVDARTLHLTQDDGLLSSPTERLLLAEPFEVGDQVTLTDFTVDIEAVTADGRPLEVRFTFTEILENPSYLFMVWEDYGFTEFTLPAEGTSVEIPGIDLVTLLLAGAPDED